MPVAKMLILLALRNNPTPCSAPKVCIYDKNCTTVTLFLQTQSGFLVHHVIAFSKENTHFISNGIDKQLSDCIGLWGQLKCGI
jgi:hypothetical protein